MEILSPSYGFTNNQWKIKLLAKGVTFEKENPRPVKASREQGVLGGNSLGSKVCTHPLVSLYGYIYESSPKLVEILHGSRVHVTRLSWSWAS